MGERGEAKSGGEWAPRGVSLVGQKAASLAVHACGSCGGGVRVLDSWLCDFRACCSTRVLRWHLGRGGKGGSREGLGGLGGLFVDVPLPEEVELDHLVAGVAGQQQVVARLDHPGESHEEHRVDAHDARHVRRNEARVLSSVRQTLQEGKGGETGSERRRQRRANGQRDARVGSRSKG